jgi:Mrp family chromosome partitioning ATPase
MENLITELRAEYDLIVLNCPPVLLVADAIFIAPHADSVLFVTHWEHSARAAIRAALTELNVAGASIAGITLNCVDFLGWMSAARDRRYYPQAPRAHAKAIAKQLTSAS